MSNLIIRDARLDDAISIGNIRYKSWIENIFLEGYMNNVIIRNYKAEDAEGKGYVHYKSWQETYTGLMNQEYLSKMSVEQRVDFSKKYDNSENTLIAETDGKVIGFACYNKCGDSDLENYGEVYAIYVLKEYHKKGIGKMLMDECVKRLSQYKGIVLWVLDSNKNTINFYEKYGFSFDGAKKEALLVTPITELRMIMEL